MAELDDGVAALVSWKENQIVFVIPAVNGAGAIYKQGQTVQVGVLLQGDNASAASNTVPYTF
ncbi:MAG TPA: IPT/TIG domain-containing protein [Candidatus Binatia bacterium]|nr:IPT/TIG domain-containing protein [Candidatus Binatia bacterium]